MSSPGREALAEAMRIESARIYGGTVHEYRSVSAARDELELGAALDRAALDAALRRRDDQPLRHPTNDYYIELFGIDGALRLVRDEAS